LRERETGREGKQERKTDKETTEEQRKDRESTDRQRDHPNHTAPFVIFIPSSSPILQHGNNLCNQSRCGVFIA
jgi:hypothetical protein